MPNPTYYTAQNPLASLLIVHGMTEHQAMYADFAKFLANHHINVMTFDHLGHGEQAYQSNTLGYMGNPNPAELMIVHVMTYARELATNNPNIPHFILGHSMGSFISRCLIQRYGNEFDGAILMGTSSPNPLCPVFVPVTKFLNRLKPNQTNLNLELILGVVSNAPFRHEKNEHFLNWLNSNPEWIAEYHQDPMFGFCFTNNGFYALMAVMKEGTNPYWWQKVPKNLPMLFVSGQDDPVGNMGKGIPLIVSSLQKQNFDDVSYKLYPKMRHEILHENNKKWVYDDVLAWLLEHS